MTQQAPDRQQLRRHMRSLRKALSAQAIEQGAKALLHNLQTCPEYASAKSVAAYLAMPGELDLAEVIDAAWAAGKHIYLPVVDGPSMHFVPYTLATPVLGGPFGIRQPQTASTILDPQQLDLILVPLLAFDDQGTRIGMGGGYYDRTFEFRRLSQTRRPLLAGVAYGFQQVPHLQAQAWDVPLDLIVTDTNVIRPQNAGSL